MFDRALEWAAAQKDRRFQLYREARLAYDAYLAEHPVPFDRLTEEDYRHAAVDTRLQVAERGYREALTLTRPSGPPHDLAVALSQLGMLLHLCGRSAEARDAFREAIQTLEEIAVAGPKEQQVLSTCHFHLGLLNLREGHYAAARRQLNISVKLDEQLGDLSGQLMGQAALKSCPADEGTPEPPNMPAATPSPPFRSPTRSEPDYRAAEDESLVLPGPFGATTREALWIMAASETSVSQLRNLVQRACPQNRELVIVTAASDSGALTPPPAAPGTSLCGAIFEISPSTLASEDFRYWITWCMNRASEAVDFRLFVHLRDISEVAFVELAVQDALLGELRDKIQMRSPDTLESLEKDLRTHLLRLEMIRDAARWRRMRWIGIRLIASVSALVLWSSIVFCLGVSASPLILGKTRVMAALVTLRPSQDWIGILAGVPLVWANLIPLAMLMQSQRTRGVPVGTPTASGSRLVVFGWAVVYASIWLFRETHCATSAVVVGAILGLLLETARRGKAKVFRLRLLRAGREIARMPSLPRSILQPGRTDPLEWPLFASGSKVFISYSRSSSWGSQNADLLHQRLKTVGSDPFLDHQSIPPGASWQHHLDEQIGESAVFIALCDEHSVRRPWVAVEVAAALAGRHTSGVPEIILLRNPSLTQPVLAQSLPVFGDIFRGAESGVEGAPRVITVRDASSILNLSDSLSPNRFSRNAVFPEWLRLLLLTLAAPVMFLSGLVPILGLPALLLAIGIQLAKVDLNAWFQPATLWWIAVASAGALGITMRQAIGARYDGIAKQRGRSVFAMMRLSAIGFAALGVHLWRRLDAKGLAWAVAALWLGWLLTFAYGEGFKHGHRNRSKQSRD
jgi:hypothetical protein